MKTRTLALAVTIITLSIFLAAQPLVFADILGSAHTIRVIPEGSTHTGEPLVTTNPAELTIFHTGQGPIRNVWLIIALNEPTYNALNQITINGTPFMTKSDFKLVNIKKIPPELPDISLGYPGSTYQYEVSAIKDKMDEKSNNIYYGYKFFINEITKNPTYFTIAFEFDSSTSDVKALILALGRYDFCSLVYTEYCSSQLNRYTPFSNSTLVVPEVAVLALTASPFGALGLFYTLKRKKK